jgi:predicted dehydrogenase
MAQKRTQVKLAVLGAGAIGRRHVEHVIARPEAELLAVIDPAPIGRDLAERHGVKWFPSLGSMVETARPEGVIIATPNKLHVQNGLEAIAAGIPALVEKPIADDVASATRLVEAAEAANVPLLVGHHRRHNPMIAEAKAIIAKGKLGTILAVQATCWFFKPDE